MNRAVFWLVWMLVLMAGCGYPARTVEIIPNKLTFTIPSGLREMSPEEVKKMVNANGNDVRAYIHGKYNFNIVVTVGPKGATNSVEELVHAQNRKVAQGNVGKIGRLASVKKIEYRTLAGVRWGYIHAEYLEANSEITLFGIIDDRVVSIAYNISSYVYDHILKDEVEASIASIKP